jgi:hypothetical protein
MERKANNFLLAGILLLNGLACSKKEEPEKLPPLDRVVTTAAPAPRRFLHKTFTLRKYQAFELEVPARCIHSQVRGSFISYAQGDQGHRVSNEAANIDLLLLDEQQLHDFAHGPGGSVTRSAESSYEQTIDWALNSTLDQPRKYYLVFNNSSGKPPAKFVQADFTLSFE